MIVDCHTHINITEDEAAAAEKLALADTVEKCIVLAGTEDANRKLSAYVDKYKEKMVGFAFLNPAENLYAVNDLRSVTSEAGLAGVVLYCSTCQFHPAHSRAMRFYEAAEELSLPIFFHNAGHLDSNAVLEYAQAFLLDEIARKFPALKIIIGSMGFPFVTQTLAMVAKHENVYADLTINPSSAWEVYNTVLAANERGVMEKLFFGSGFPAADAGECIETLLGFNKLLGDTNLPVVPRGQIRNIIERDTLGLLGIEI